MRVVWWAAGALVLAGAALGSWAEARLRRPVEGLKSELLEEAYSNLSELGRRRDAPHGLRAAAYALNHSDEEVRPSSPEEAAEAGDRQLSLEDHWPALDAALSDPASARWVRTWSGLQHRMGVSGE